MMRLAVVLLYLSCQQCVVFSEPLSTTCSDDDDDVGLLQVANHVSTRKSRQRHEPYFWPSGRGTVGNLGVSAFPVDRNISAGPTWSWHSPKGRWSTIPVGTCIDDEMNIYLTLADGMNKFSQDGELLWTYERSSPDEEITDAASLWDGAAYGITTRGRVFAVNMDTGKEDWSVTVAPDADGTNSQVAAHAGVVIVGADATGINDANTEKSNRNVVGLNATNGAVMWTYTPDVPVWNMAASFVGDGTFVFQDMQGRAHRNWASNGSLIWKSGGIPHTWTDGQVSVGPNGIVYAVANFANKAQMEKEGGKGALFAYRLSDGKLLWNQSTPKPPNGVPVVGTVAGHTGLSVVLTIGQQCLIGEQIQVHAYDAETGQPRWSFEGPSQQGAMVAGDFAGIAERTAAGLRPVTLPNPWSQAAIDSQGTVFVGGETGHFFSLRDANGDGHISMGDDKEVSVFENGAAFVGSSGPAIAPGLLAIGAIDSLHVWKS